MKKLLAWSCLFISLCVGAFLLAASTIVYLSERALSQVVGFI